MMCMSMGFIHLNIAHGFVRELVRSWQLGFGRIILCVVCDLCRIQCVLWRHVFDHDLVAWHMYALCACFVCALLPSPFEII